MSIWVSSELPARYHEEIRTPTVCRPGKGPEHTDLLFGFLRPRAVVGLPAGFVLEASWVSARPGERGEGQSGGLGLQRSFSIRNEGASVVLRLHAAFGLIQAPIACDEEALQDPTSECFQGTLSDDRYHPHTFGAEGTVTSPVAAGRFRPFLGGGINILHPRFQVNFTNQFGEIDNRKVEVDLTRGAIFGGATWSVAKALDLTGEIYSSPGNAVTGRITGSYAIHTQP